MSVEREVARGEPMTSAANVVEVRIAAEPAQLAVMRAVVGDLAMRADYDIDSIADLRLAVDEACSSLIRLAAPASTLVCRFRSFGDALSVIAEVPSDDAFGPRKDTFSWRVLSALADVVSTSVESDPAAADGSHLVRIELTKGRTAHV
ncbi:serine/threonine-protein kinase RsbW [Saccharopolyspora antimicrobica]|uniref:Serine/threonine-protein kinase RsbW n=1 Tax=Saccharopolyspora antimicrobica TaxID=455193 RepID=A0A1I4VDR6_9PSEU|nr:ATP-binding protein [Saccharopolyspora antimicrobica]RKT86248.1 serine/threonine-protein kinase RsbW [Saccharopolyspora antimicrobica]SFM99273.1 serine/threonine-protein kinase RsbW [Saccharopolyspora antimicrobica]